MRGTYHVHSSFVANKAPKNTLADVKRVTFPVSQINVVLCLTYERGVSRYVYRLIRVVQLLTKVLQLTDENRHS